MEVTDTPQLHLKANVEADRRDAGLSRLELMVTTVFERLVSADSSAEGRPKAA